MGHFARQDHLYSDRGTVFMEQLGQYGIAGAALLASFSVLVLALRLWARQIEAERQMFREVLAEERDSCLKRHEDILVRLDHIDDKLSRLPQCREAA